MSKLKSIIDGLNAEQQQAVSLPVDTGPVMVLAGAGTGKTSVLTKRIAYLCAHGVSSSAILAVTFTNKAAREMKERLIAMGIPHGVMIGTFHSIGLRILKRCPEAAGVTAGFTVMDEDDTRKLWKDLFVAGKDEVVSPGSVKLSKWDNDIKKFMTAMFSAKERGMRSSDPNPATTFEQSVGRMLDIYETERKKLNRVDFSDLISASLDAIQSYPSGRAWADQFTHILVDEFQDTSKLQFAWATSILRDEKKSQHIFAVGDDSQSIYSFRGANIENISRFVVDYGAVEIMLEQNYRCGSLILQAANNLIAVNINGDKKKLWTENGTGEVRMLEFQNDRAEAAQIAEELSAVDDLKKCAVLVRTRGAMIPIVQAFRSLRIEHHVVGAMDYFDAKEIKDAMSLVRFAVNHQDSISFQRMGAVFHGVGKKTILAAVEEASGAMMSILDICAQNKKLHAIYEAFKDINGDSDATLSVRHLVEVSGLMDECRGSDEYHRVQNVNEFCSLAGQFGTLGEFIDEMTLFSEKDTRENGVTVSTIHAAKWLEWERVYIPVLNEAHLPITREMGTDPESKHLEFMSREEERRLMYVAITRAKRYLTVSFPKFRMVNGQTESAKPSRFLKESGLL